MTPQSPSSAPPSSTPPPSAAERAYEALRTRILDGELEPGTMLGETPLAAELAMSRTPVRSALTRLQDEGWVTIYPKRGALVRGLGPRAIAELAEARVLLETASMRRATDAARASAAERLEDLIADQRAALAARDLPTLVRTLQTFHRVFVEAGDSQVQLELYARLADRHRFALSSEGEGLFARGEEALTEHTRLLQTFRDGDESAFEEVLRAHVAENGAPREAS